ncbi:MAG TPA: AMP-binding protein [Candidatus Margulisiibacteriota bacterium]|nr:AMP-binding protein [Candidatus Margulisiibacteriota bacterium]
MPLSPTHPSPQAAQFRARGHWPQQSLATLFARTVQSHARRDALVDGAHRLTFDDLDRLSQQVAVTFCGLGLAAGDVIAYQLPNWWEAAVVFLAALRIGATVNPLLPIFREAELRFTLRQSGARVLVIPGVFRGCDHRELIAAVRPELPALREVLVVRGEPAAGTQRFAPSYDAPPPPTPPVNPDSIALLMYTSGTTAEPKGVLHTHNTLAAEVLSLARVHQLTAADRTLMPSPLTHISGVIHGILTPALLGTSAVLMERWEPARAADLIDREQVTYMVGAPTFLQDLLAQPLQHDASSLRLFSCGGAGVSPALMQRARERFPNCVAKRVYGSTEFPTLTTTDAADAVTYGIDTEGRAIAPAEVRIADASGMSLPAGAEGEVHGRGPECFVGYLDAPLNAEAFTPDGWFRTGDLGVLDAAGYLRITGRLKDIIIRKGEKISVKEVEDAIAAHAAVAEVVVIPCPDPECGERACAIVRPRAGQSVDLGSLRAFLSARGLAKQKWPEQLEVVADFPRTDSGKILRTKLKEQFAGRAR